MLEKIWDNENPLQAQIENLKKLAKDKVDKVKENVTDEKDNTD